MSRRNPERIPANQCPVCHKVVQTRAARWIDNNNRYHLACIKCTVCHKPLDREITKLHEGKIYCAQHAPTKAQPPPPVDPIDAMEKKVKASFDKLDTNKNGTLDPDEFSKFCEVMGDDFTDWEIHLITRIADQNHNGIITYREFRRFILANQTKLNEDDLKKIFNACDSDGNGTLIWSEFKKIGQYLGVELSKDQMKKLFKAADTDKSGGISFDEFKKIMLK
ncbi:calmodulin [Anaeramoeba ignava]|uniref:Calmodulin n=1 Tax=Anaeramoeba ignava TaxID=1746090 RepID=A0A9Q0LIK0_ANAIG|nr:calmodulin [Anaeramoeba ignava]